MGSINVIFEYLPFLRLRKFNVCGDWSNSVLSATPCPLCGLLYASLPSHVFGQCPFLLWWIFHWSHSLFLLQCAFLLLLLFSLFFAKSLLFPSARVSEMCIPILKWSSLKVLFFNVHFPVHMIPICTPVFWPISSHFCFFLSLGSFERCCFFNSNTLLVKTTMTSS